MLLYGIYERVYVTFNFDEFDKRIEESLARPHGPALNQSFPCVDNDGEKRLGVEDIGKETTITTIRDFLGSVNYTIAIAPTLPWQV